MLQTLRQNSQSIAMFITSILLFVWLTLSCQNCFAMEVQAGSDMHASMECCPPDLKKGESDNTADAASDKCVAAQLLEQPVLSDELSVQLDDQIDIKLSVHASDYPSSPSSGLLRAVQSNPDSFSHRLFSSYRILLI